MSVSKKVTKKAADTTKPPVATRQRGKVDAPADTPSRTEGSEAVGDKVVLDKTPEEPAAPNVKASTAARALAASRNFDLSTVKGTGAGGVITKSDVQNALDKDVANYEESIAPVPGTMGLLQESQVDTGPDYGAIGGMEESDRLAQLQEILDKANRGGTGGEMIRKLSEYQKSQPPAPAAPPEMDMSRLDAAKFPGPEGAGFEPPVPAMDMSLLGIGGESAGSARPPAPWDRLSEATAYKAGENPVLAMGGLSARDFPGPEGAGFGGFPESAMDTRRMSDPAYRLDLSQLTNNEGGAIGDYGPPSFTPEGGAPGEYGPPPLTPGGGAPGGYGPPPPPRGGAGASGPDPADPYAAMGAFGAGQTPPADNSAKFLASRGLSGLASDAWEYAKKHPGRVFLGGTALLGGGALAMANLRGGGGGSAPTAEEMDALARERDEARARAAQGYQQRNAAPLTMPQ